MYKIILSLGFNPSWVCVKGGGGMSFFCPSVVFFFNIIIANDGEIRILPARRSKQKEAGKINLGLRFLCSSLLLLLYSYIQKNTCLN